MVVLHWTVAYVVHCLTIPNIITGTESEVFKFQVKIDGKEVDLRIPGAGGMSDNITTDQNHINQTGEEFVHSETRKRLKRTSGHMTYDRKGPKCRRRLEMMKKGSNHMAVQFSVLVENKQTAKMTCHYCDDEASDELKPMNWFRLHRQQETGVFEFSEVGLDMHDDPNENRVYKAVDHTLLVKRATDADAGSYFCHDFSVADRLIKKTMSTADIETILTDTDKFRFFYHLDVLRPSKIPVDEVSTSEYAVKKRPPSPPVLLENMNLKLITEWQKWSRCSECNKPGERKRLGICVIQKANTNFQCEPWYLESVMLSNPTGVPCRSSVFKNHVDLKTRPDELLREKCTVKCTGAYGKKGKAMRISGLTNVVFGKKAKASSKQSIKAEEGKELHFICPGAQLDTIVTWFNRTRPLVAAELEEISGGRIEIDAHNVLHIHKVIHQDAGKYQCVMDHNVQVEFKLKVFENNKDDFWEYTCYLLLTYPVNFTLFLMFMIVKHRRYKMGVKLNDDELKLLDELSSSPSLDSSGSGGSSGSGESSSTNTQS